MQTDTETDPSRLPWPYSTFVSDRVVTLFPVFATGDRQTLRLREVIVWKGRMEAQIRAEWAQAEVTFFHTRFVLERTCYEAGGEYNFSLCGIAYDAGPAAKRDLRSQGCIR